MEYTYLGHTGLQVSRLCLGTMNFSLYTEESDSFKLMDAAIDAGINFWDTANVYGHHWFNSDAPNRPGLTEEIMGRWFAQGGGRRDKVVLATKFGHPDMPELKGASARVIKKSCEDSLRRMQTDYIDLYQLHHVDLSTPWEEFWQAIEQLIQEGKILYAGSSNFGGWHITAANEEAKRRNLLGLVTEQSLYNLAVREVELDVVPVCEAYGMGILPWSPLNHGALAGVLKKVEEGRRSDMGFLAKKVHDQLVAYETFCDELGHHPAEVALAWLLHQPVVTAPIIGPRTLEHLEGNIRAVDVKLDEEALKKLDEIWPGYKTAPEHYAW